MRLYLVDTSIFVFKAWYGPDKSRVNRCGEPNQAFVGFSDFVYRLLTEQAPARLVFAFDQSLANSARKQLYPEYKANRSPAPQELRRQFGWCREWLEGLGISCVASDTWEADDLIGSLAFYHRNPERPVAFLTADKDLAQLVQENDLWWSYLDDRKLDYRGVCKKFGVEPRQIAEQLALAGDRVDNIPGIPGVGQRTATRLLRKYGSIANLRQHLHQVGEMKFRYAGTVQRALIENEALLDTSIALTRIECGIEAMKQVDTRRRHPDQSRLRRIMDEQGFEESRLRRWNDCLRKLAPAEA